MAVSAGALTVDTSLAHVIDSVSGVDRKPTPILLLPVDGHVATALRSDLEESWLSSTSTGARRRTATRLTDDASYRYRRQRNNEAARRSREKRRRQDGVIRHQLETLAAENRQLRCQLALFRRLLDEVAAGTFASPHYKDDRRGPVQPGWSSTSSSAALSIASDQSYRDDVTDESSVDDVTTVGGELKRTNGEHVGQVTSTDVSEIDDWHQHQPLTPLNLSQRVANS